MMIPLIQMNSRSKPQWASQPARWVFLAALFGLAISAFSQQAADIAAPPVAAGAPAQVFHAEGTGGSVAAQSARGNASRAASSGGGGGGAQRK